MVRALPDKKAHSDRKKGTEPRDSKNKVKQNTVANDSPSVRKKYFKELPGGILPKNGNPKSDNVNENDDAKVLLELEKRLQRSHPPKLTLNGRPHPERVTYGVKSPPNAPPTGGRDTDSPYGNYPRGMWGGDDSFQRVHDIPCVLVARNNASLGGDTHYIFIVAN